MSRKKPDEKKLDNLEIQALVDEVGKNGKIVLDLTQVLKDAITRKYKNGRESSQDSSNQNISNNQNEGPISDNFDPEIPIILDKDVELEPIDSEEMRSGSPGSTPEMPRKKKKTVKDNQGSDSSSDASDGEGEEGVAGEEEEGVSDGEGAEGEEGEEEDPFFGRNYGVDGWGNPPIPSFRKDKISRARAREIQTNPEEFIEFIYQNRRFKLKPIGTIEPVPKRIYFGINGAPYYYKTRGPNGEKLGLGKQTKIYLKNYQKRQCFSGLSDRTRGLAGYMDVNGACLNQPARGRYTAARTSKTRK